MEQNILTLQNVYKNFGKNQELKVLRDITLNVNEKEFVSILGSSGSGKSTLLRLIGGLITPSQGNLFFKNQKIIDPPDEMAVVFQDANLMPWRTVHQNITLPLEICGVSDKNEIQKKVQHSIELVGLNGFEEAYPANLSGGMAQRVSLARALIQNPDMLLLDEPFGALDAITRERMGEELLRIWQKQKQTILMITHSIQEAVFLSDRIIVLSNIPAKIILDIKIEFPRPRTSDIRYTTEFGEYVKNIYRSIE